MNTLWRHIFTELKETSIFFYVWIGTIDLTVYNQSWLPLSVMRGGPFFRIHKEKPVVVAGTDYSSVAPFFRNRKEEPLVTSAEE